MSRFMLAALVAALLVSPAAQCFAAAIYPGNGNASFGGPIGLGSLNLTDDGTTLNGTINKGPNGFNDVLVLYIDSVPGGFADTSGINDNADGLRRAISGLDPSGANKSVMTFLPGFRPDYAIALGPASDNFGGLFQLAAGGPGSLPFIASVNLNPVGNNNSPNYQFSLPVASLGIAPNSGATFELFGTYISNTGFRSGEALPGNDVGNPGWNPFQQIPPPASYTIVPEPATVGLLLSGMLALAIASRCRRGSSPIR